MSELSVTETDQPASTESDIELATPCDRGHGVNRGCVACGECVDCPDGCDCDGYELEGLDDSEPYPASWWGCDQGW